MNKLILTLAALSASVAPQIALAKSKVPVFVEATFTRVPNDHVRWAAVRAEDSNGSPLAVGLPSKSSA